MESNETVKSSVSPRIDRLLISALLLNGSLRYKVLRFAEEEPVALAPELGIDLKRLIHISSLLDNREKNISGGSCC